MVPCEALMPCALAHSAPVFLAFLLLFLEKARDTPTSTLLCLLFPLSGMPFPQISKWIPLISL